MNVPSQKPKEFLSVSEVAELLEVTRRQIQYYVRAGRFPNAWRAGSGKNSPWVIPYADVKAFLAERREDE